MTTFFQNLFTRYPVKTKRALEVLPGFMAWMLILSPLWGSILIPTPLAYFILFFDVYWLYKSFSLVITASIASKKIADSEKQDWNEKTKKLSHGQDVHHLLIILNYKESVEKIRKTLTALSGQTYPTKNLHIVLAMEERETEAKNRGDILIKEYKHIFGSIFATY